MSAAEKLRALDGSLTKNVTWLRQMPVAYEQEGLVALRNALPQIVAVVEAAEFARNWPHMPSDLRWEDFDAALAALDEALDT